MNEKKELGIYIHIPFCKSKCYYCDFVSFANKDEFVERYIKSLKSEIQKEDGIISTIYMGGGTPSYIDSKYIKEILEEIKKKNNLQNPEITIEVNPGTITEKKLKDYKEAGVNRLSIGLQSCNNRILEQIGRIHTYETFLETYKLARMCGFENINVDLMLGLPNQTIQDLKDSLEKIISLNPEHISVYSLILEENTKLYELVVSNKIKLSDEETERDMYWYMKNTLELSGFIHYEISNFAKKGYESKHNMNCWEQKEYVGYGVAAHSYINKTRYSNTSNIEKYLNNPEESRIINEIQTDEDMQKEYMLLGLRKIEGISIGSFKKKFGCNPLYLYKEELNKLVEKDLIVIDSDNIRLTNKGLDFANIVWQEFV